MRYIFIIIIFAISCSEKETSNAQWYEGIYKKQINYVVDTETVSVFLKFDNSSYIFQVLLNEQLISGDKGNHIFTSQNVTLSRISEFKPDGKIWFNLTSPIMSNYNYSKNKDTLIIERPDNPLDLKTGIYIKTNNYE